MRMNIIVSAALSILLAGVFFFLNDPNRTAEVCARRLNASRTEVEAMIRGSEEPPFVQHLRCWLLGRNL